MTDYADSKQYETNAAPVCIVFVKEVRATQGGTKYSITHNDQVLIAETFRPFFDACRALAARGQNGELQMWRDGNSYPDMVTEDLVRSARLTVTEGRETRPTIIRYSEHFAKQCESEG